MAGNRCNVMLTGLTLLVGCHVEAELRC